MVKKFFKKKSKVQPMKMKFKVKKKIREHAKKERRNKRREGRRKRSTKDPGIPNMCPFKEKLLDEEAQRRQRLAETLQVQKESRFKLLAKMRGLDDFVRDAEERDKNFQKLQEEVERFNQTRQKSYEKVVYCVFPPLKAYYREFQKVVAAADVVLEVLDARDPLGCRCPEVERMVLESGSNKRLVLVLNKIDLVPLDNLRQWLKYLKNEFPTVPFKASTQLQKSKLRRRPLNLYQDRVMKTNTCLGAEFLMKLLGNYCRNKGVRVAIRVGIVGFPNVGKSSIINSLKRSKACSVGATPGVTKVMQEVQLDEHVMLLDSPGIVLAKSACNEAAALRNIVKVEKTDPFPAVEAILRRTSVKKMMAHYKIPGYTDVQEFLPLLAKRMGKVKKSGVPHLEAAARMLVNDWNLGRIKYFTHPPVSHTLPEHVSAKLVTEMAKEFDVNSLLSTWQKDCNTLKSTYMTDLLDGDMALPQVGLTEGTSEGLNRETVQNFIDSDSEDDSMDVDRGAKTVSFDALGEVGKTKVVFDQKPPQSKEKKKNKKEKLDWNEMTGLTKAEAAIPGNQRLNTKRKMLLKAIKKREKRTEKMADKLCDKLQSSFVLSEPRSINDVKVSSDNDVKVSSNNDDKVSGDDYDFSDYFH